MFTSLDPAWCDGWLMYDTEIHLTVHNSNGFPVELFEKNCLPDPETKKYTIKVTAMDIDKVIFKVTPRLLFSIVTAVFQI